MATAKKSTASKAPAKAAEVPAAKTSKNRDVVKFDEILAQRALAAKKAEAAVSVGQFISIKSGVMSYNGNPVPGNALDVVVLDSILENHMYDGKYNPDVPQSPICFSFGRDEDTMVPHKDSVSPQAASCKECPHNVWGSAEVGRGKACSNVRRLAIIPADALDGGEESIKDADLAFFKVPVTSSPKWTGYVNTLAAQNRPPLAFVTEISVVPDPKTQLKVNFKAKESIDDGELLGPLIDKADVAAQQIDFPYKPPEENPAPARGKTAGRGGVKAPASRVSKPANRQKKY